MVFPVLPLVLLLAPSRSPQTPVKVPVPDTAPAVEEPDGSPVVPALSRLQQEGDTGRQKLTQ